MTKRHLYKEKQTFSLRKYSFGVASVLLAASVMLSPKALAEEQANNTASTQKVAEVSAVSQSEMKEATTNELVLQTSDDTKIVTNQAESVSASTSPISTTSNTEVATENTVEASEDISSDSLAPKVTSEENNQADSAVQDLSQQEPAPETVALESPTVESYQGRAASAGDSLEPSGTYTFTERTEVKNTPRVSAPTEFYMTAGQKVNYDQVVNADGYEWISYKSYSGIRRYAPVLEAISIPEDTSSDSPKEPVALDIPEQGRYTFTRNTEIKTVPKVSEAPTFIFSKGDSVYYDKSLVADGHQWISYISYSGARYYADIANLTETNPSQETPDKRQDLAPKGRYLFTKESVVKNEPKRSAPTEFVFVKGESVYYDKVLEADGRQWISYISYNGMRRYVDIAVSQQTQNQQPTGHLNVQHNSNGDFTVLVSNVADSNGIKAVKVPVWTSKNDQDEIIWYDGVKQTDGSYKVDVKRANHNNEYGEYNIHLYYIENSGKMVGVTTTKTVTKPQAQVTGSLNVTQKANGDFTVLVSNVADSNGIKAVKVPVWTSKNDQDEIIWYDGVKQTDGSYKVDVKRANHNNEYGEYNIHLYYVENSGKMVGVTTTKTVTKPQAQVTGSLNVTQKANGDFTVLVSNVADSNGIKAVKVPVWTSKNDQDEIIWYDGVKQTDGSYKVDVKRANHNNEYGEYNIHLYYIENSGKMVGVTTTKTITHQPSVSHLQGKISIQHKTDKGFDVLITDIQSPKGISEVLLPIWSTQNGQDDIVWYQAHKTSNGDYVTSVTIKDHKNNTGEYAIHLYYKDKQGVLSGVATATTTIDKQSSLNYNGSYYSVTGKYGDEIIIVNKKHPLAAQYNPGEVAAAKSAFINLRNDMIRKGYNVGNHYSGFRSYDYQKTLYQNYVNRDGQAVADRYSARPGYSEHQTGLSFDMTDKAGNLLEDKAASRYLKDNAHHYGFIVRYQAGKEKETGFMPEAWHLRYVGQEAKDIYASGLSLEAYYGIEGGDYVNSRPNPSSTNALPSQGSYQFTKRAFIKTEPKMTSPDLAYYDAGNRVNYDKLVMADGHQWLSYLSYGGQRRYIAID